MKQYIRRLFSFLLALALMTVVSVVVLVVSTELTLITVSMSTERILVSVKKLS